ncbi:MAG: hypothetical protein HRU20_26225 [Pseudomonadales bacterium]|nr:hypothetical protein [Pseudomonadales bacterium]
MNRDDIVIALQQQLGQGKTPAELLRFLTLDQKIEDQIELMQLFCDAFDTNLGSVTAIGGWWYESPREMNDKDVNAYIQPVLDDYLAAQ